MHVQAEVALPYFLGMHTCCSGELGRPGQLLGELAILTLTPLKSSSTAGQKFSHQDVPKLPGFDPEYFLHTLYLCIVYLGLAREKERGKKEGPPPLVLHSGFRFAGMLSGAETLDFPPHTPHLIYVFIAYLLCPPLSPCKTNI